MFDLNNLPTLSVKKIEGYWSVLMDGCVHESGYGERFSAEQAARRLKRELLLNAEATRMTINSIMRKVH